MLLQGAVFRRRQRRAVLLQGAVLLHGVVFRWRGRRVMRFQRTMFRCRDWRAVRFLGAMFWRCERRMRWGGRPAGAAQMGGDKVAMGAALEFDDRAVRACRRGDPRA